MPSTPTPKAWTVMVYMAGDNSLDSAGIVDLKEMKKTGSTPNMNVIAQFDRSGRQGATCRYYLRKGGSVAADQVASLGETNGGDPKVLEDFITWGITTYPAQHYLLVIWNHGNGWSDEDIYHTARDLGRAMRRRGAPVAEGGADERGVSVRRVRVIGGRNHKRTLFRSTVAEALDDRGIAYDDNAQDFLDNVEMKTVLDNVSGSLGRKVDILGMDACLMSMAEVGYQLRDSVAFTVGSEETEPDDGWPYDTILTALARNPAMVPRDLAATIVQKYLKSYDSDAGVTQAACNLTKAGVLAAAVNRLGEALTGGLADGATRMAIERARLHVQCYTTPEYVDLYDFCQLLHADSADAKLKVACQAVMDALTKNGYVVSSGYQGAAMGNSHGLAIYFPERLKPKPGGGTDIFTLYSRLDFTHDTCWQRFIQQYLAMGQRQPA